MKPKVIHQFLAGFRPWDAISNESLLMRSVFRSWGCKSGIISHNASIFEKEDALDFGTGVSELGENDIAILHLSIGSKINLEFAGLKCRKVILYHNITPGHYFRFLNSRTAADLNLGRKHLELLADTAEISLADSAYNAAELTAAGYKNVSVFPFAVDVDSLNKGKTDAETLRSMQDGVKNILFVGRFAPNKKIEDIVSVMYYLTHICPNVRLIHAGAIGGCESYFSLVSAQADTLALHNVFFKDGVKQEVLNAYYESADAFLCMSEHEGFCVPIVEAMLHHVPVFALATSAVPETLGGAGVLFGTPPNFPEIAETIARVINDPQLKSAIVAKQDQSLEAFRKRDIDAELRNLLAKLL